MVQLNDAKAHRGVTRDRSLRLLFVLGAGLLATHSSWATATTLAACEFIGVVVLAGWAIRLHSNHTISRLAIVGTALALGWAGPHALNPSSAWRPFFAQSPGEVPLLLARMGLLFALVIATEEYSAKARAARLAPAAVLLIASLCFRVFFWPCCCVSVLAIGAAARRTRRVPCEYESILGWVALALATATALAPSVNRHVVTQPQEPAQAVSYWLQRANPYRAHHRAQQWAKQEVVPGEGYLALARIDIAMTQSEKARKVLTKILARTESPDIRKRAQAMFDGLQRESAHEDAR